MGYRGEYIGEIVLLGGLTVVAGGLIWVIVKDKQITKAHEEDIANRTAEVFEEMDFGEMSDPEYHIGDLVQFNTGICYENGWQRQDGQLSILFEDDMSNEAFFAYTTRDDSTAISKANAALQTLNCSEDFVLYGKKVLSDSGNPEMQLGALEFKLGPYRTERIMLDGEISPHK